MTNKILQELLVTGIEGKSFVAGGILSGGGSWTFDHKRHCPKQGKDVYQVLEINAGTVKYSVSVLVRTSRKIDEERLTYEVPLSNRLGDELATEDEIEIAKSHGFLDNNFERPRKSFKELGLDPCRMPPAIRINESTGPGAIY